MDVIEQLLKAPSEILKKILAKNSALKEICKEHGIFQADEIGYLIDALLEAGQLNSAEDLLFLQFELIHTQELYDFGLETFARMWAYSDAELEKYNFTRAEIKQGIWDFNSLYSPIKSKT